MGSYIYTLRKRQIIAFDPKENKDIKIGVMEYAFKPYWDLLHYATSFTEFPKYLDAFQKKVIVSYKKAFTRAENNEMTKYFVIDYNKKGIYSEVFKTNGLSAIVDDSHCCDQNHVGTLVKQGKKWIIKHKEVSNVA